MYQSVMGLSNSHHSVSDHQLLPKNIAAMPRYIASSISTNSSSSKVWLSFSSNTPVFLRVTWSKKETAQRAHRLVSHQFSMIAFKTCGVVFFVTGHWPWQSMQTMITINLDITSTHSCSVFQPVILVFWRVAPNVHPSSLPGTTEKPVIGNVAQVGTQKPWKTHLKTNIDSSKMMPYLKPEIHFKSHHVSSLC